MTNLIRNYDQSIATSPAQLVVPETVEDIQAVLRDRATYPSPVRAKGSYHSLTPCVSSDGTIVDMSRMTRILDIDTTNNLLTAEAGVQIIEAARALRELDRQLMTNVEIGNMTLGSAACCHSKDALDGIEFGQVSSYVTRIKWVTPDGALAEASEADSPDVLRLVRSSYGLCGIVYEVTLRIKPVEVLHFTYVPRPVDELTQVEVDEFLDTSEGLICWTVGRTCVFQRRQRIDKPGPLEGVEATARRELWSHGVAHAGRVIDEFINNPELHQQAHALEFDAINFLYSTLGVADGIRLYAPDKIIDYSQTPPDSRYAFTFWAFPRSEWLTNLRGYLDFADDYFTEPASAATCRWVPTTFVATPARSCRTRTTAQSSRSTPFTPAATTPSGTRFCASSMRSRRRATACRCSIRVRLSPAGRWKLPTATGGWSSPAGCARWTPRGVWSTRSLPSFCRKPTERRRRQRDARQPNTPHPAPRRQHQPRRGGS